MCVGGHGEKTGDEGKATVAVEWNTKTYVHTHLYKFLFPVGIQSYDYVCEIKMFFFFPP